MDPELVDFPELPDYPDVAMDVGVEVVVGDAAQLGWERAEFGRIDASVLPPSLLLPAPLARSTSDAVRSLSSCRVLAAFRSSLGEEDEEGGRKEGERFTGGEKNLLCSADPLFFAPSPSPPPPLDDAELLKELAALTAS
jgi:hypothetical protein